MSIKKVKLTYKELAPIIAVLLATQYFVINGIILKAAIQIGCFTLLIFSCLVSYNRIAIKWIDLCWLISIVPFFYAIKEWTPANLRDFVAYFSFVILIIFVKCNSLSLKKSIRLLYVMAIFHAFFCFFHVLFRDSFTNFIYAIIDDRLVSTFDKAVQGNYYTGFGYIPGDTSGYLINGIFILFFGNKIIANKHHYLWCIIFLLGVFFCGKRSHLLCLFITIILVWILMASKSKKVKRIICSILSAALLLILGYILLPYFSNIPMLNRISQTLEQISSGQDFTSNRYNLIVLAMQFFSQNKIWGIGWKNFNQYTFNKWGTTNYVNNVYIQLITETGIVGGILFILPMVMSLCSTIKKILVVVRQKNRDTDVMSYLSISLALQIFFLLYGFLEIPFYDYTFLFVYGVAIVISNSVKINKIKKSNTEVKNFKWNIIG